MVNYVGKNPDFVKHQAKKFPTNSTRVQMIQRTFIDRAESVCVLLMTPSINVKLVEIGI